MNAIERSDRGTSEHAIGTAAARRPALLFAVGSTSALAMAATADVTPEAATWFGVRGPYCPLGTCFGALACPGCGLVRSVAATVQGDFGAAWTFHPAGPVIAALLAGTALVHFDILRRRRELRGHRRLRRAGHVTFVLAVLAGWLLRLSSSAP
ncbi:MAG: DUF2752 domain-containing protein [Planctomycetota bacterium]